MEQVYCTDCLKMYKPLEYILNFFLALWFWERPDRDSYIEAVMSAFSYSENFKHKYILKRHLEEQFRDRDIRNVICSIFHYIRHQPLYYEEFYTCYKYAENQRHQNMIANFLCFDCEKYVCSRCITNHQGHVTFSKDDKYNIIESSRQSSRLLDAIKAESVKKLDIMEKAESFLSDVFSVSFLNSVNDRRFWYYRGRSHIEYERKERIYLHLEDDFCDGNLCVLNDNKRWLITGTHKKCIGIFNINTNKMSRIIKFSDYTYGLTEIPSTDSSQSLIAVCFTLQRHINIIDIDCRPARIMTSINVSRQCEEIAYCNNKLITRSVDYIDSKWQELIYVMDLSGKIIHVIDLLNIPYLKLSAHCFRMFVHAESETIYVCHFIKPSCVVSLSLDGHVLNSVTFSDLEPISICVDKDQNVYVIDWLSKIYRLSANLREIELIVDKGVDGIRRPHHLRCHNGKFYLVTREGYVSIIIHKGID